MEIHLRRHPSTRRQTPTPDIGGNKTDENKTIEITLARRMRTKKTPTFKPPELHGNQIAADTESDFRICDLMQADHPLSLYIVVPDSDRLRLKPLTRLMITLITQRLVEVLNPKENKHRLLMLLDEFPRLGRMTFLSDALSYLAGYGIKVMLMMQSKGQLDAQEAYGRGNTIIESCRTRTVFTPQDPDTAQWVADTLGSKTEVHQQTTYTGHRLAPWLGHVMVSDQESSRPLMDAAEICKLPASDAILLVAGFPPFKAKRAKYYEDPVLAARAGIPPPALRPERPYPYRPRPHTDPWAGCIIVQLPKSPKSPPACATASGELTPAIEAIQASLTLEPVEVQGPDRMTDVPGTPHDEPAEFTDADEARQRLLALDEQESAHRAPLARARRSIPL